MAANRVDIALELYDAVSNALTVSGLDEKTAAKYAFFATELYTYVKGRPQLQTALQGAKSIYDTGKRAKGYALAARLAADAKAMNAFASAEKFEARGGASAGSAISGFVDYFAGVARSQKIEMNECALSVTKVILEVLSVIALTETVVGVWAAALQALSLGANAKDLIRACSAT